MASTNMNKLEYYPEIRVFKGSGILKSNAEEINLNFSLVIYPHAIRIYSDYTLDFFAELGERSFLGHIEDGQIEVSSPVLMLFSANNKGIKLMPQKEFIIGSFNNNQIVSAEFPLIGYYGDEAEFEYENCLYRICGDKQKADQQEILSKTWKVQLEGFNLEIKSSNLDNDEFVKRAIIITDMLSLATGNEIGFNRQIYNYLDGSSCEIWRSQHLDDFGAYECVPHFRISYYLKQCFPIWLEQISEAEKKTINVAVNYINSTSKGYLEERLLRIAQAWELVSTDWIGDLNEVPEQIENLKVKLKDSLKAWRNDFPEIDKDGFWTGRVLNSLSWDKSIVKAEQLASKYQINLDAINLDLKKLFNDRNSVAHSGRFKDYAEDRMSLIDSAVLGLQLILLKKLGYKGMIHTSENGWTTYKKIEEFLIN